MTPTEHREAIAQIVTSYLKPEEVADAILALPTPNFPALAEVLEALRPFAKSGHYQNVEDYRRAAQVYAKYAEGEVMKPGAELWARKWVREFWIDQMRRCNAPDLPDNISIEVFQRESERLADKIEGKTP